MNCPRWSDVREDWEVDGGLRDAHVFSTDESDWEKLPDLVHAHGWWSSYTEDGDPAPMPPKIADIFERRDTRSVHWQIRPVERLAINFHFFSPDQIEFDFDPREISGQARHVVCEFIRASDARSVSP